MKTRAKAGVAVALTGAVMMAFSVIVAPAAFAWHGVLTAVSTCKDDQTTATFTLTHAPDEGSWNQSHETMYVATSSAPTVFAVGQTLPYATPSYIPFPVVITAPLTITLGLSWVGDANTIAHPVPASATAVLNPDCHVTTTTTEESTTTTSTIPETTTSTVPESSTTTSTIPETTTSTVPESSTTTSTIPETTTSTIPETTTTEGVTTTTAGDTTTTAQETTTTVPETTTTCVHSGNNDSTTTALTCVVAPPTTVKPTPPAQLPRTGSPLTKPLLIIGLLVFATGCFLTAAADWMEERRNGV